MIQIQPSQIYKFTQFSLNQVFIFPHKLVEGHHRQVERVGEEGHKVLRRNRSPQPANMVRGQGEQIIKKGVDLVPYPDIG